jgi:phage baseplate assembly protein W
MPGFQPTEITTISDEIIGYSYEDELIQRYYSGTIVYQDLNTENVLDDIYIYNMQVMVQSVLNMLYTEPGERLFRPSFGSSLNSIVFAPINAATSARLKQILINSIETWDPRITVNRSLSRVIPLSDEMAYEIHVLYEVPSLLLENQELIFNYEV